MCYKAPVKHRRLAIGVLLICVWLATGCATTTFEVDDAVRFEDGQMRMVGFAQRKRGWFLSGVEGVDVSFAVRGAEVARAVTDERGFVKVVADVDAPSETFQAAATISGESYADEARVFAWRRDRVMIACDIDSTISATSVRALFFDPIDRVSTPIEDSPEVLHQLARTHHIAYVTARPRFTQGKTRTWLETHGYPDEPIITSLTAGDALAQTGYKTRTFRSLRKHYTNLLIGIGNTDIDADSYGSHGMLAILMQPKAQPVREGHVVRLQSWQQIGAFFEANAAVLRDPRRVAAAARGEEKLVIPAQAPLR